MENMKWPITSKEIEAVFKNLPKIKVQNYMASQIVVVKSLSCVQLFVTPRIATCQASLSFIISDFAQVHVHWISDAIQIFHPLSLFSFCLQSFPTSGSFPKSQLFPASDQYWSFSFSISPSNEYSGLIPFKINCLTSLLSKGLKSFLQHHSLLYGPTLTSIRDYWTKHSSDYMIFVCKVMSLLWKRGMEIVTDFIFLGSNIAEDSDWRHKLKDAYSLEEKLWQT